MAIRTKQVSINDLIPHPDNVNEGDVGALTQSLEYHGQYRAIVVSEKTSHILAGNHTWMAAKALGWDKITAHLLPDLTPEQERRIMLADNQYARLATRDDVGLADMLQQLADTSDGLSGTGFDGDDLDILLADIDRGSTETRDIEPRITVPEHPESKPGDIWQCGDHRVICGDAADPEVWQRVTRGEHVNVAVTSPPYAEQREYDPSSGFKPIPPDEYVGWFKPIAANIHHHLADDGSWFLNIKPSVAKGGLDIELYVFDLVLAHVREWGWHLATEFCWERNGMPKSVTQRFKNQFEPVYQFAKGRWKMRPDNVRHISDYALTPFGQGVGNTSWDGTGDLPGQGVGARLPHERKLRPGGASVMSTDVQGLDTTFDPGEYIGKGFAYPGNRLPTFAGTHEALGHAAAYPVGLPQFFIEAYTDEGDLICDPFAGTGSTLIAADNTKRKSIAIEISPAYCDVIVQRWQALHPDETATRL